MKRMMLAVIAAGMFIGNAVASDAETNTKVRIARLEAEIKSSSYGFGTWLKYTVPATAVVFLGCVVSDPFLRDADYESRKLEDALHEVISCCYSNKYVNGDYLFEPYRNRIASAYALLDIMYLKAYIPIGVSVISWVGAQMLYWHKRSKNNAKVEQLKAELQVLKASIGQ